MANVTMMGNNAGSKDTCGWLTKNMKSPNGGLKFRKSGWNN